MKLVLCNSKGRPAPHSCRLLRSVPIQRIPLYGRTSAPCGVPRCSTLLIRARPATAALRAVSCREAIRQFGRGAGPKAPYHSPTGLPGVTGLCRLAPHTARGLGKTLRQVRPKNHRPTPPGVLPIAGNENKARNQALHQATCRHSPKPNVNSRSSPAVAAPVPPRGHQKRVSTLRPPFPPSPPSHLIGAAVKRWAAIKFGGKGGLRAPLREGLPPKPPAKVRPNKLGGTRPRQGLHSAWRQSDGGGSRRPGSALKDPPP